MATPNKEDFPYTLEFPDSGQIQLEVIEVFFDDRIDDLFRVELVAHAADPAVSTAQLIGHRFTLRSETRVGPIAITGMVTSVRQESCVPDGVSRYRVMGAPLLWLLSQRVNNRIFQDLTVVEIVTKVLQNYASLAPALQVSLSRDLSQRQYTAQYHETDWHFVQRILSEEGLALVHRHDGSGSCVIADKLQLLMMNINEPIVYHERSELRAEGPQLLAVQIDSRFSPAAATVRDYNALQPTLPLEGKALDAHAFTNERVAEQYHFQVGQYASQQHGSDYAQMRLEGYRAERLRLEAEVNFVVGPGSRFTLVGHARADVCIDWRIISVALHADREGARRRLVAIPAEQPYRPRLRPKPRIIGTQTAFVVGSGGEEIDVDEYGRVCVEFHWDRRGKDSETTRRLRVSQAWAGPGYGLMCVPRVGDEVVVDFLDGDPDRPIVVGRVHNGLNVSPRPLPAHKETSTWRSCSSPGGNGFNEIALEDRAGAERIYVHAQRDVVAEVINDVNMKVGGHVNSNVAGNTAAGVVGNGRVTINGNAELTVGSKLTVNATNIQQAAKANFVTTAGDQRHDESTNHFVRTGGYWVRAKSTAQFVTPNFHVFSGNIKLISGGSMIHLSPGGITIKSSGPVTINGSLITLN